MFSDIQQLAHLAVHGPDDRAEWLKDLPWAHEPYYRFLRLVAHGRRYSVEIGTRLGTSASHLADGCRDSGTVLTIDLDPSCAVVMQGIMQTRCLTNVVIATTESSKGISLVNQPIDLLFIDGDHTYESSYSDYLAYRPYVADGGLIIFDDPTLSDEMRRMWGDVVDEKILLPELHHSGFGVAIKTAS